MKKLTFKLFLLSIILCMPLFFACNNKNIVGTWDIYGYEFTYLDVNNESKTTYLSLEEAKHLEYNDKIEDEDVTSKTYFLNLIFLMTNTDDNQTIIFQNNNTGMLSNQEFSWKQEDDHYILILNSSTIIIFNYNEQSNIIIVNTPTPNENETSLKIFFKKI